MATFDPTTTEARLYRAVEEHLRAMSVPEDQWLRVKLYARLDPGGGLMTTSLSVEDTTRFRSLALPEERSPAVTSLTDTGVQTGQLGSEGTDRITDWPSGTKIPGGEIREPVQSTALQIASLSERIRDLEVDLEYKDHQISNARQERDQASALAVRSLELLRMVPTASMSEDLEVMHHALLAHPQTRETQAVLEGFLSATVDRRASELVRDRLAETEDKHRMVLDRVDRLAGDADAKIIRLQSQLGYQRARGWCEMGLTMILGIALIGWLS